MIDPPGFALENFDAVGRWREIDEEYRPIDASGTLPDGTTFDGLAGFRATLLSRPERFVTTVAEKLLIYALDAVWRWATICRQSGASSATRRPLTR